MSKKLQCKVPSKLGDEITRLQIKLGAKGKALNRLTKAALADAGNYPGDGTYGADESVSCTLTVNEDFYADATLAYREKYELTTATAFFKQALQHGALVLAGEATPAEAIPNIDAVESASAGDPAPSKGEQPTVSTEVSDQADPKDNGQE
ncbi:MULTISPECIES: hypothetical protein [Sphingomonas]|uniref:hypothetical protein n=1 Tax=Sphingomonas TaxID=13687 RepID=UPI000AD3DAB9|nr:hypothetical protein [Sphingomonas sp. CCH10-B3]